MENETDEEINKKLSISIKNLDAEEMLLKETLNKIKQISKEINLSTITSEKEVILITSKIEEIKTTLRTSYEYLTNKFEIEIETDKTASNY